MRVDHGVMEAAKVSVSCAGGNEAAEVADTGVDAVGEEEGSLVRGELASRRAGAMLVEKEAVKDGNETEGSAQTFYFRERKYCKI